MYPRMAGELPGVQTTRSPVFGSPVFERDGGMMERVQEKVDRESAGIGQRLVPDGFDSESCQGTSPLSNDETERFIALCEAPALRWLEEPAHVRAPEPFGMIA
jgi:hypothetical protein